MPDNRVRIFVSSPADVDHERALVKDVIERLAQEYLPYFELQAVLWEEEALTADRTFQASLTQPEDCDIVLVILWTRLGSPLPEEPYRGMTGTEWEFINAVEASAGQGRPEVLVYKKTTPKLVDITDAATAQEAVEDRRRLDDFFRSHFFNEDNTFRRAFRVFDNDAAFRDLVEVQLRKLLNRRISAERRRAAGALEWHGSPFRAERPFEVGDERVFTGREQEVRALLLRLEERGAAGRGLVLLSGPSGSGKTSLLRAGLVPRLIRPFQFEEVAAVRACLVDPCRDGKTPVAALAARLCADDVLGAPLGSFGLGPAEMTRLLLTEPAVAARQIGSALNALVQGHFGDAAARLALIVDPFEAALEHDDPAELSAFAAALHALAVDTASWVVAALRSDALPKLEHLEVLHGLLDDAGCMALEPPVPARIRQVVEIPARVAGIEIDAGAGDQQRGLVELLEADAAALRLWAPPLQAVLDQSYQRAQSDGRVNDAGEVQIGAGDYRASGGLAGYAVRRADDLWQGLDGAARDALPMLCRALISLESPDASRAAIRRGDLDVLRRDPACARLIQGLIDARLVIAEGVREPELMLRCDRPDYSLTGALRTVLRQGREDWLARLSRLGGRDQDAGEPLSAETTPTPDASLTSADEQASTPGDWQQYRAVASFAHPALLRDWRPVRDWLSEAKNRQLLVQRFQLSRQAQLWKRTNCNREYLFRAAGYAAAETLADQFGNELEPLERDFLDQSSAHLGFVRRRNRLLRGLGAALMGLLLLASLSALFAYRASSEARENLHRSKLKEADIYITRGNTPRAVDLALEAGPDLPERAVRTLSEAFSNNRLLAIAAAPSPSLDDIRIPGVSGDGERLATLLPDAEPRLWRLARGRYVPERDLQAAGLSLHSLVIGAAGHVFGIGESGIWQLPTGSDAPPTYPCGSGPGPLLALDRGHNRLALARDTGDGRHGLCVVDLNRPGRVIYQAEALEDGEIRGLDFSPDGKLLLTATDQGRSHLIDLTDGSIRLSLPPEGPIGRPFNNAVFDGTGERIAIAAADERIRLYRTDGTPIGELSHSDIGGKTFKIHNSAVRDVAFAPSGDFLVAVDDDGKVVRWSLDGSAQAVLLGSHRLSVGEVEIIEPPADIAAETLVLTASLDATARIWGLQTGGQIAVLGHDAAISAARFGDDGRRVVTFSARDGTVRLWSIDPVSRLAWHLKHPDHVWDLAMTAAPEELAPDGDALLLATAGFDGGVRVWLYGRAGDGAPPTPLSDLVDRHRGRVRQVSFSDNGRLLASAGYDGTAHVNDLPTQQTCVLEVTAAADGEVYNALFGPGGRWLVTTSNDAEAPVRLFSPGRCAPIDTGDVLRHGHAPVEAAAVKASSGGALVVTGDGDGVLRLFQVSPAGVWQQRCEQQADVGPVNSIAIAPDGGLIAVAGGASHAALLAAGDDTCPVVQTLDGHTARVYTIAFSPDGAQLVTASLDKTARLWDRDGSARAVLLGHQDRVYRATFSPGDGRWLLTASRDGSIRVWRRPKGPATGAPIDLDAFLPLLADAGGVASAAFSPDGHYVAGAYWENAALLWRLWSEREEVSATLAKRWGPDRARLTLLQEAYRFRDDTVFADLPETETETDIDQEQ